MSDSNIVSQNVETQTVIDNNITVQVAQATEEQITIGVPGPRGPTGPMGSGVAWRGEYDPSTAYELHDAVSYLGSSYACFVPCIGVVPTETSNWELVAAKGDTGADGVSDIPGPRGYDGTPGTKGDTGITGAPGEQGVQGIQGVQGQQGETGVQGIQGVTGDDSTVAGPKGDTGSQGPQGAAGTNGTDGIDGIDGVDGNTVLSGSGVPDAGLGLDGDFYVDTANDTIYGPKTTGAWGSATSIVGPQGEAGTNGTDGADGADSTVAGPQGEQGIQGEAGAAGTTDYTALSNKPTLGTASPLDVPATGDASATQVVKGSDTRLADPRVASDVSAWAKNGTKPTYASSEITNISAAGQALIDDVDAAAQLVTLGAAAYSEGTWTPVLQFGGASVGITYGYRVGYYRKIGNMVCVTFEIYTSSKGTSTGSVNISVLPFSANGSAAVALRTLGITTSGIVQAYLAGTDIALEQISSAGMGAAVLDTNCDNIVDITGSIIYCV